MYGFGSKSIMNDIVQNQWIWIEIMEIRESRVFWRLISSTHCKIPSSHVSYALNGIRSETYFNEKSQLAILFELRCQTYPKLWSSVPRLLLIVGNALYFLHGPPAVNSLLPWIPDWSTANPYCTTVELLKIRIVKDLRWVAKKRGFRGIFFVK